MPIIKPISNLRNKSNEISDLVHNSNEPVFITRNGEGNMVILSMPLYSQLLLKVDLMGRLTKAQASYASGDRGRSISDVMNDLKARINEPHKV